MFELLFLFLLILGFVMVIKVGAVLLHLIFIPFQIIGGLFVALLAAPLIFILMPIILVGFVLAGMVLFGVFAAVGGALLGLIC